MWKKKGCRDDGMVDIGDLKSPGQFGRVGSTPIPGTTVRED